MSMCMACICSYLVESYPDAPIIACRSLKALTIHVYAMCVYIYIHYVCIHMCMCIHIRTHIYIYIYVMYTYEYPRSLGCARGGGWPSTAPV